MSLDTQTKLAIYRALRRDRAKRAADAERKSRAAFDGSTFQLLALRRNLFQELIRRATQRTLFRPDRHDLPFGLGSGERTILGQVFALAARGHRGNERDADP